jgi:hypothetical protein
MRSLAVLIALLLPGLVRAEVELTQVISREHPLFVGTGSGLSVGGDGSVYLYSGKDGKGYVLRVRPDGSGKFGGETVYAITGVAANKDGLIATSNAHFSKAVHIYDKDFRLVGKAEGFTGNDTVGWDGPGSVEAGASGDFYALDQHANRVVRIGPDGKIVRTYPIRAESEADRGRLWTYGFRVCEAKSQFYFLAGNNLVCVGFDGKARWTKPGWNGGNPWDGFRGGFDVDADGRLYVCDGTKRTVVVYDSTGKESGKVELAGKEPIAHLRVSGDQIIARSKSATELFRRFSITEGRDRDGVDITHERLVVRYPSPVWTAGEEVPLILGMHQANPPGLHFWIRELGTSTFTDLGRAIDKFRAPTRPGLYQWRLTAGLDGGVSEYLLESVVEVRLANAVGSVSILTPLNRMRYGAGEPIPVRVVARSKPGTQLPETVEVRLHEDGGADRAVLKVKLDKGEGTATLTDAAPGSFRLTATVSGWTVAEQPLVIGPKFEPPAFRLIQHGDYGSAFPEAKFLDASEKVAAQLRQAHLLGLNTFVERMGHGASRGYHGVLAGPLRDAELSQRLAADPLAISPLKAEFADPVMQTIAGYGAQGTELRGILLYMDAGLPLGTGFDKRKPEELLKAVGEVTGKLKDYPAFRGWSWAANWWIDKRGAALARSPEEKTAYEAALKEANTSGKWSPVLESVSDLWINYAIAAEKNLRPAAPGKISAMTAPYRQPGILPNLTFAAADEVDLHWQAEQIQWPRVAGHNVDFYKRPGKPAWGHPELWNDDGTGGHILAHSLEMVLRGANGVGQSGSVKGFSSEPSDPRSMGPGATSIHRALNEMLRTAGPWMAGLERVDPIVIPVSTRMQRLELDWKGVGGFYFTRLYEAYNACLHAHRPARFAFVEDLKVDSFKDARAILVVSQTVELEPALRDALAKSGLPIYADKTCRAGMVPSAKPLDIAFDRVEADHHVLNDDSAFPRFRDYFVAHAAKLNALWGKDVPPLVECSNPEVRFTELRKPDGLRFLVAVNDMLVPLDPGLMWRVGLSSGCRFPLREKILWAGTTFDLDLRIRPWQVLSSKPDALPPAVRGALAVPFGPHLRDAAISGDGKTALVSAASWDRNVYTLDLADGKVKAQGKVGHHYAYGPLACGAGFVVQGFDLTSAEGYHLYRVDPSGKVDQRFALYGYPGRGTSWANSKQWQEPINNFAAAPDGSWFASSGDLGLAVWDAAGKRLWSRDDWKEGRTRRHLVALGSDLVVSLSGAQAVAYRATTGEEVWKLTLGTTGILTSGVASADGSLLALISTAEGGRIFLVKQGKLAETLAVKVDDLALSADGTVLAVTRGNQLDHYAAFTGLPGLRWTLTADDVLRKPAISRDGKKIACCSELGTLYVRSVEGQRLLERDLGAWHVPAWLPDGDLLVVGWNGQAQRLAGDTFTPRWTTTLQPDNSVTAADLTRPDPTPTARIATATNALPEALPLTPNLLKQTDALIEVRSDPKAHGDPRPWVHKIDRLRDGDPTPPETPWLEWTEINYIDSGWRSRLTLNVDTFRTQIRLEAITFVEDPAHPESWLRNCRLEYWDPISEAWRPGPYLLSNQATHSHRLEKPIEAARFRIVSAGGGSWPAGNLRLGELVFHGQVLGPSHPDAVANRPVAVLFDEREDDLKAMMAAPLRPFSFHYADAYHGGKSLLLKEEGSTVANWQPPFGHCVPGWDFEIVENPTKPGEYRWLQFAWKRLSPATKGIGLGVGPGHTGGWLFTAGEAPKLEGAKPSSQAKEPPADWTVVRVDLWKLNGSPYRIRSLTLATVGGGALFDQIVLGRSEADLPK